MSTPGIFITHSELDALRGLSDLSARLYPVLRRHMDYSTGLVGKHRRISYQMLREACEVVIPRGLGHQHIQPTVSALRVAIASLGRSGMVRQVDDEFVFSLPLAVTISARSKQTQQSDSTVDNTANPVSMRLSGHTQQGTPRQTQHTSRVKEKPCSTVAAASPVLGAGDNSAAGIAAAFLERLAQRLGYPIRYTLTDHRLTGWVESGLTFDAVEQATRQAIQARHRDGSSAPLNPGFISVFLDELEDWRQTWSGIVQKGAALGLTQEPGEIAPAFKARVFAAAEPLAA